MRSRADSGLLVQAGRHVALPPASAPNVPAARLLPRDDWRVPAPVIDMTPRRWCEDVMRRRRVLVFVAGAVVLLGTGCGRAAAGRPHTMLRHESAGSAADRSHPVLRQVSSGAAGSWGRAIAVPGLAALNKGREAVVLSVSCSSAGNCGAGGYYHDGGRRGFVDSETNGRWRQAVEVPCASAGSCAAGGFYRCGGGHHQGFVVNTSNGRWRQAIQVPGLAA